MVSSKDKPQNFPIYAFDTELGSTILFNESADSVEQGIQAENQHSEIQQLENQQTKN